MIDSSFTKATFDFLFCLYVTAGKKDKVRKFDLVGSFFKKGELEKEDLGIVEVKDNCSYVAVKRSKAKRVIQLMNKQRIKKKKVLVQIAR